MNTLIVIVALLWLVSPAIGARIWARKGGSQLTGCIVGALLGPFSWAMYFTDSGKRICPACKSGIPKDATACAKCGRELPA